MVALPASAYAANVGSANTSSTQRVINNIIRGTPGVSSYTTTGTGVVVRSATNVGLAGRAGLTIPVAASAVVTGSRLGGIAGTAIRFGGWVGIASVVLPWIADQYGIKVCPPPDFFCMPGEDIPIPPDQGMGGYYVNNGFGSFYGYSPLEACKLAVKAAFGNRLTAGITAGGGCGTVESNGSISHQWSVGYKNAVCPAGTITKIDATGRKYCANPGPDRPATEPEISSAVESAVSGNPGRMGDLYGAIRGANIPVFAPGDAVTVDAPPVNAPATTRTTTRALPDGSTETVTTKTETVVTPQVQGNTIGNTTVNYPTTTTTTTTTTNNITNITHTTTTVTNNISNPSQAPDADGAGPFPENDPAVPQPEPEKIEIPKDYNKEITQKSIYDILADFARPITETVPTGDGELASIETKNAERVAVIADITEESTGLRGWLPEIRATQCVNPQVPNPITKGMHEFVICDTVDLFGKLFGAVASVFALYGCVREVQTAMRT